jgi:DNA-binding PadR family transcriptional regulator
MTESRLKSQPPPADPNVPKMPGEHALLGLLASSEGGSGHGYDLARHFGPEEPLGNVMRLEPGMVYHQLKKIERMGWVSVVPDSPDARPARRTFRLTESGRAELWRWLAEPVAHTREIRLEFLVKLYFALILDSALATRLIDEQRETCARIIESIAERLPRETLGASKHTRAQWFGEMVLDMRLAQSRAALAWLDRLRQDAFVLQQDEP